MCVCVRTAGEVLSVDARPSWARSLLAETFDGEPSAAATALPTVRVLVEADRRTFSTSGWAPLSRDAYVAPGRVLLVNACSSGFDLLVTPTPGALEVVARYR